MVNDMKQIEVLNWAFSILKEHNREENVANILLQHHLTCTNAEFYMNMREVVSKEVIKNFKQDILEHIKTGIPVQHLLGYEYFYGEKFMVNEHTLIPRPETEELVDLILKTYPLNTNISFIDLGTGSGIIGVSLAKHFKNACVYASDISQEALAVAKENARRHNVDIHFFEGDFLKPIIDLHLKIDVIVSNPPYIDYADLPSLSDTVKDFDPHQALFADNKGLAAYETIMMQINKLTEKPQAIYFEIGHEQSQELINMFIKHLPQYEVSVKKDINNKDRIVIAKYSKGEVK